MAFWSHLYPVLRRNSTFALLVVAGGLTFDEVFNRSTRHFFFDVLNKGKGYSYLEPNILLWQAAADDDE